MKSDRLLHHRYYPTHASGVLPLVIMHGLLGSKDNWRSIAQRLSVYCPVYCLDCRNHGDSFHDDAMSYDDMASDLLCWLKQQGITKCLIMGHSMGGKLVMRAMQVHPEFFAKAIIVDIVPKDYDHHHENILTAMAEVDVSAMSTRTAIDAALTPWVHDAAVRQLLLKNIRRSEENVYTWICNHHALRAAYPDIMKAGIREQKIGVDTLFICGETSSYIVDTDREWVGKIFTNMSFQTIKGAGHWVQAEQPQAFLECVTDFLFKSGGQGHHGGGL